MGRVSLQYNVYVFAKLRVSNIWWGGDCVTWKVIGLFSDSCYRQTFLLVLQTGLMANGRYMTYKNVYGVYGAEK
jgi:hypothetical protein